MVESGRRVVIGLENGNLGPRIPNVYDDGLLQETPYDFDSAFEEYLIPRIKHRPPGG